MDDSCLIGKIVKTRGLKGELKVQSLTDFPHQFADLEYILLRKGKFKKSLKIQQVKFQGNFIYLNLSGINSQEQALIFVGCDIYIENMQMIALPPDYFRFEQIKDFQIVSLSGENIGTLQDIEHFPASDMLVIDGNGKEILIPFVKELVPEVNLADKVIKIVDMPSLWREE
jgi:16S rRNA processing protein RimM